jgi:hypothetical protein
MDKNSLHCFISVAVPAEYQPPAPLLCQKARGHAPTRDFYDGNAR